MLFWRNNVYAFMFKQEFRQRRIYCPTAYLGGQGYINRPTYNN